MIREMVSETARFKAVPLRATNEQPAPWAMCRPAGAVPLAGWELSSGLGVPGSAKAGTRSLIQSVDTTPAEATHRRLA